MIKIRIFSFILILLINNLTFAQSSSNVTRRVIAGPNDPAVCQPTGTNIFLNTTTDILKICSATNTWTGTGGVSGSGASTDNAVVRWDGAGGNTLQNSLVIIGDTGNVSGVGTLGLSNTITSTQGTITANTPFMSHTSTWNNAGVTFVNFLSNVTDTASNASSLLFDFQLGGSTRLNLTKGGVLTSSSNVVSGGSVVSASASFFVVNSRSKIGSSADGILEVLNNAGSGFTRLNLGGTTSSFPSIKRNGAAINFRLADDSADANITAGGGAFTANITLPTDIYIANAASANWRFIPRQVDDSMIFVTNGATAIRIASTGNAQVGTGADYGKFTVGGTIVIATNNVAFQGVKADASAAINLIQLNASDQVSIASSGTTTTFGGDILFQKTITAAGTTGAQTINKTTGSVNFAAAAASLVVTNSLVTANSIIHCTVATNDGTMKSAQCVAGSGSFTIFPNANPTGETRVNFIVTN